MLSIAVDICKTIIETLRKSKELRLDDRLRVSTILEEISKIILDTAEKLKIDEYPHYNCALLEKLSERLHFHLIDFVKPADLDNLHDTLKEASQIEKTFALRKEPETIPSLEEAAAEFKTLSILIKISS